MKNLNHGPIVSRRSALAAVAASAGALALAACGNSEAPGASSAAATTASSEIAGAFDAKGATLTVSTWGFNSDQKRELVFAPFEKAFNCKIVTEEGNNGERLAKIQQKPEAYDVIQLSHYYAQQAIEAGLFAKIEKDKVPNLEGEYEKLRTPNGEDYGPAFTLTRVGIVYDKSVIKDEITSWADLWRSELAGKLAIPDFTTSAGPIMLNIAAAVNGQELSADTADAAFKKLVELKPNVVKYYTKSSDVVNMFNQGEVSAAVILDFSSLTIQEASEDFVWVDPKEGTWATANSSNVSAKSANADLAWAFVNYTLDKDEQQRNVATGDAPSRPDVTLTDEQAKGLAYGEDVINATELFDAALLAEHNKEWTDRWNKELNTSGK